MSIASSGDMFGAVVFLVLGSVCLLPLTRGAVELHYRKQWGDKTGPSYQKASGVFFLAVGLNMLAGALGLPHIQLL